MFICLYFGSNTSLMDEVGRIGGWWSFLGQVFQKLEQKWITFFKGTDSLNRRTWTLRSFATSCSLLVKVIQNIEKSTWSNAYWMKSKERKRTCWRFLISGIWPRSVDWVQIKVSKENFQRDNFIIQLWCGQETCYLFIKN